MVNFFVVDRNGKAMVKKLGLTILPVYRCRMGLSMDCVREKHVSQRMVYSTLNMSRIFNQKQQLRLLIWVFWRWVFDKFFWYLWFLLFLKSFLSCCFSSLLSSFLILKIFISPLLLRICCGFVFTFSRLIFSSLLLGFFCSFIWVVRVFFLVMRWIFCWLFALV
jgi:hypothetical protein